MDPNKVPVRGDIHVIIVGKPNVSSLAFEWNQTLEIIFLWTSGFIYVKIVSSIRSWHNGDMTKKLWR